MKSLLLLFSIFISALLFSSCTSKSVVPIVQMNITQCPTFPIQYYKKFNDFNTSGTKVERDGITYVEVEISEYISLLSKMKEYKLAHNGLVSSMTNFNTQIDVLNKQ